MNNRILLTETWNDPRLSLLEKKYINPFVDNLERFVVEAKLSPEQIRQLFTDVEAGSTAAGGNRTGIGKAVDVAKLPVKAAQYVDQQINKLGRAIQNSGPVKNIDAKFDQLKAKLDQSDSKVAQGIKAVSDWAKANPGKASLAVGILTTAAAMAGGPMGGAVAGFLARATKDLLQGEKLSTAVGKSIKTAALGALTGKAFEMVGDWLGGLRAEVIDKGRFAEVNWDATKTIRAPGMEWTQTIKGVNIKVLPEDADTINNFMKMLGNASDPEQKVQIFDKLYSLAKEVRSPEYKQLLADVGEVAKNNDSLYQWIQGAKTALQSVSQGAVQAAGGGKQTPAKAESKKFTALQIETIIEWCDGTPSVLTEGPLDAIKKGAAAVGGAIKKGAAKVAQVGKNLTTKITADKLNKAWAAAGKPDDSDQIADILRKAGVDDKVLAPIYKQLGVTLPAGSTQPSAGGTTPSGNPRFEPQLDQTGSAPAQSTGGPAPAQGSAPPSTAKTAKQQPNAAGSTAKTATGTQPNAASSTAASAKQQPAAGVTLDFKGIQQAVAKLSPEQAKELVTHIDSLNKQAAPAQKQEPAAPAAPTAAQNQTPSASTAPAQEPTPGTAVPAGAAPAAGKAPAPAGKNAAANDTYEKAKGDVRNVQSGSKPLPPNLTQSIEADLAKLAKGDKESGVFAADKIMKLAKLGMDVKDIQAKWIANSKAGERFLTQSQYFEITKMLREYKLSWSDLGLRVHLLEGTNKYFGLSRR